MPCHAWLLHFPSWMEERPAAYIDAWQNTYLTSPLMTLVIKCDTPVDKLFKLITACVCAVPAVPELPSIVKMDAQQILWHTVDLFVFPAWCLDEYSCHHSFRWIFMSSWIMECMTLVKSLSTKMTDWPFDSIWACNRWPLTVLINMPWHLTVLKVISTQSTHEVIIISCCALLY